MEPNFCCGAHALCVTGEAQVLCEYIMGQLLHCSILLTTQGWHVERGKWAAVPKKLCERLTHPAFFGKRRKQDALDFVSNPALS